MGCNCITANDSNKKAKELKEKMKAKPGQKEKAKAGAEDDSMEAQKEHEAPPNQEPTQYQVKFYPQDIAAILEQTELEDYLLDAVVAEQQQSVLDIINRNQQDERQTVTAAGRLDLEQKQPQPYIADVSKICLRRRFQDKFLVITTDYKTFRSVETALWNPLLLMIAMKQERAIERLILTRGARYLHFAGCLSKPYSPQRQANKAFPHSKRIKRECFGLKLAIYNKDENILAFLIDGQSVTDEELCCDQMAQIWNLGHILQVIKIILKVQWAQGLRRLFQLQRVKTIVKAVNDIQGYINFLSSLIEIFFSQYKDQPTPQMQMEFLACLDQEPYVFTKILLGLFLRMQPGTIQSLVGRLHSGHRNTIPFFRAEIEDIFAQWDPQNLHPNIEKQVLAICDESEQSEASEDQIREAVLIVKVYINDFVKRSKTLQQGQRMDEESVKIIDDIDALKPYASKQFDDAGSGADQSLLTQMLSSGNEQLLDYLYSSASEFNIRALLVSDQADLADSDCLNYRFEVEEQVGMIQHLQVSLSHFGQFTQHRLFMEKYRFCLMYQIDSMSLDSVQCLLYQVAQDEAVEASNRILLISTTLTSSKFRSLFNSALEMDKWAFVTRLHEILGDEECFDGRYLERFDKKRLNDIQYKDNPEFVPYLEAVKKGDRGEKYSVPTKQEVQARLADNRGPALIVHAVSPQGRVGAHPSVDINHLTFPAEGSANQMKKRIKGQEQELAQSFNQQSDEASKQEDSEEESEANKDARHFSFKKEVSKPEPKQEQVVADSGNMRLDMNVLTSQQNNSSLPFAAKGMTPQMPSEQQEESYRSKSDSEQPLSNQQDQELSENTPSEDGDGLDADEIQLHFEELKKVQICSEISIAYTELLGGFETSNIQVDEVHEVLSNYALNPFEHLQINWGQYFEDAASKKNSVVHPDKYLWNLFLFAIHYDQTEVVEFFLNGPEYKDKQIPLAILRPPKNNQEYHIMDQKYAKNADKGKRKNRTYNQLAIQLAVKNQNLKILTLILDKFQQCFTCTDLCEINEILLGYNDPKGGSNWQEGMKRFLKAAVTKSIFVHLRPEDKELFIGKTMMEPLLQSQSSTASQFVKMITKELKQQPYNQYCVLRFPNLYQKYGILDKALASITEDDIIVFISANPDNLQRLLDFSTAYESKKQTKHQQIREIIHKAQKSKQNEDLIQPNDATEMIKLIQQGKAQDFIKHYQALKAKADIRAKREDASDMSMTNRSADAFNVNIEDLQLFRYLGHQMEAHDQIHEVDYIPQDEAIQQLLYDIDEETLSQRSASMNSEEQHLQLINKLKSKVIQSESWNPLIFAIYFGQEEIVSYILKQTDQQQLYYLLSDPFRVEEEGDEDDKEKAQRRSQGDDDDAEASEFLLERSELFPLVLCLTTKNAAMFSLLWDHPCLWNRQIYLILLGNFVFETQTPSLIRAFLLSSKTRLLYNSISLCEKQKFVQFTIKSLEQQIVEDEDSQFGQEFNADHSGDEDAQAEIRTELERILNVEMLSQPPYSLVNLTENLLPLNLDSTYEDLVNLIEQYEKSPESREILELTLQNLAGGLDAANSPEGLEEIAVHNYANKWQLINANQIWAKKLSNLIEEVAEQQPEIFESFKALEVLQMDIFKEILNFNES